MERYLRHGAARGGQIAACLKELFDLPRRAEFAILTFQRFGFRLTAAIAQQFGVVFNASGNMRM